MRISILAPDLSSNSMGAVLAIKDMFIDEHDVEIIGPDFGKGVNPMYVGMFEYKVVDEPNMYRIPEFYRGCRTMRDAASGDVIVAVKAFMHTVPTALNIRHSRGVKVIVYLDEWDGAAWQGLPFMKRCIRSLKEWWMPLSDMYYAHVERRIPEADAVVCTSSFLQRKFGGHRIPMGVDTTMFKPLPSDAVRESRDQYGIQSEQPVIVFGGVVREHKGVEDVVRAVSLLRHRSGFAKQAMLVIAGAETETVQRMIREIGAKSFVRCTGPLQKDRMPVLLSMADVIVVPQGRGPLADSQMPCKLFEAMAVERPIVAADASDIPEALGEGGWVYERGNIDSLVHELTEALTHRDDAQQRARNARQRTEEHFSFECIRKKWHAVLNSFPITT